MRNTHRYYVVSHWSDDTTSESGLMTKRNAEAHAKRMRDVALVRKVEVKERRLVTVDALFSGKGWL